ncbi:hypothetical protein PROFUN_08720, partial [Planoprotostelium fungivorum]
MQGVIPSRQSRYFRPSELQHKTKILTVAPWRQRKCLARLTLSLTVFSKTASSSSTSLLLYGWTLIHNNIKIYTTTLPLNTEPPTGNLSRTVVLWRVDSRKEKDNKYAKYWRIYEYQPLLESEWLWTGEHVILDREKSVEHLYELIQLYKGWERTRAPIFMVQAAPGNTDISVTFNSETGIVLTSKMKDRKDLEFELLLRIFV